MVYKPGPNEIDSFWGRADKIGNLFLSEICAISETDRRT